METKRTENWLPASYIPSFWKTQHITKETKEEDHICNFIVPWVISDNSDFKRESESKVLKEVKKKNMSNKELTAI